MAAPSLGAGSAGDVEGLAEALAEKYHDEPWFGHSTMAENCGACRDIREVLAAHFARASTADREQVLGEVLEALRAESVDAHDPKRQRGRDLWGLNVARRVVTSLAAPRVERDDG